MDKLTPKQRNSYNRRHGIPREERVPRDGANIAPHPNSKGDQEDDGIGRGYSQEFE